MEDRTVRPSMKPVWAAYLAAAILAAAGMWAINQYANQTTNVRPPEWAYLVPLAALLVPLNMHMKRRMVTMTFHDGHLTMESGFLSRTRRTVDMVKIQDVTVQQSFGQRLMGTGDLRLESAGESGAMGIANVDQPREIADFILESSKKGARDF
jgi:uncharacterized membrane protein YdbT with pleckstrin-like domain